MSMIYYNHEVVLKSMYTLIHLLAILPLGGYLYFDVIDERCLRRNSRNKEGSEDVVLDYRNIVHLSLLPMQIIVRVIDPVFPLSACNPRTAHGSYTRSVNNNQDPVC